MTHPLATADDPAAVLAVVRARRADAERAEADVLVGAATFASMCSADSLHDAAAEPTRDLADRAVPLAGDGAPLVAESAVVELAAALGLSTASGRKLLGDALELRHRLPLVFARVLDGTLAPWRARQVAERTKDLVPAAAAWVDRQVAPRAERLGYAALVRLAEEAMATYDPERAAAKAEEAKQQHRLRIDLHPIANDEAGGTVAGLAYLDATLDAADALDVEAAVAGIAHDLVQQESYRTWSLDQRRAAALGVLARHYTAGGADGVARVVHLHAHVDKGHLAGTGLVAVDETSSAITVERLVEWCTVPGTLVEPVQVIDLGAEITRSGYVPSVAQHQQAALVDETCVFPYCAARAWGCDTDHRVPYAPAGAEEGGRTESGNLSKLCRSHHRAKTFLGWTYQQVRPGEYLWRSPHGYTFLRHRGGGTTDVTEEARPAAVG